MNCILYKKNSNKIKYFIRDCVKEGINTYRGSNCKLKGVKFLEEIWTLDKVNPVYIDEEFIGWDKAINDITSTIIYNKSPVGNRKDVNNQIVQQIREKYSINEELKLARSSKSSKEWKEYNTYVTDLVKSGLKFKDKYFPKEEV